MDILEVYVNESWSYRKIKYMIKNMINVHKNVEFICSIFKWEQPLVN